MDVKIFKNQKRRSETAICSPDEHYIMVGGGVSFDIFGSDNTSESFNRENYRTGLSTCYPSDERTWEVKLNKTDLERMGNWDLSSYVIAIKGNGKLENHVKKQEQNHFVSLDDRIFYVTSGGTSINNVEDRNTYLKICMPTTHIHGNPSNLSVTTGWVGIPNKPNLSPNLTTSAIAIRHSGIEFLPLFNPSGVILTPV